MLKDILKSIACAILFVTGFILFCNMDIATGAIPAVMIGVSSIAVFYLGAIVVKPVIDKYHKDEEV